MGYLTAKPQSWNSANSGPPARPPPAYPPQPHAKHGTILTFTGTALPRFLLHERPYNFIYSHKGSTSHKKRKDAPLFAD